MRELNFTRLLQALLLSGFAIFALGFSHVTFSQPPMAGMESMSAHAGSSVQCQMLCTTATKTDKPGILSNFENEAKDPLPVVTFFGIVSLSLLAVPFIIKRLHLLSSWRPPDCVLLCGHFADGL